MATADRESGRAGVRAGILALCLLTWGQASLVEAQTASGMVDTKHNLAVSGPGPVRALAETRICVFCHTPHNATPLSPLWNKDIEPQVYTVYSSPTIKSGPLGQPMGPTKLCLSCHDGTIGMGAVVNPTGGIGMAGGGGLSPGSLSDFGLDLSAHHPVSFPYRNALPDAELAAGPPPELVYGGTDVVHCVTCHDPHKDTFGKFLVKDNRYSALCVTCHQISGWGASAHATSTVSVAGILPRPPKTWPAWTHLNEWGCEVCHTPHFAATGEGLLNFTSELPSPFSCTSAGCHGSAPTAPHLASVSDLGPLGGRGAGLGAGTVDITAQTGKMSGHHEQPGMPMAGLRGSGMRARPGIRGVGCVDCHNPHLSDNRKARAPYTSGMLQGVSGLSRNGAATGSATYEYEICFKCHSDSNPDLDYVPRVVSVTNTRMAFDPVNESYHPVVSTGKNQNVPSIPSPLEPDMSSSEMIYCTACHADDEGGSRGPHGSVFAPILRERYETTDYTPESYENYALCYRCHDRSSILRDASFQKKLARITMSGGGHSGHLAAGASCAACHDPHGVSAVAERRSTGAGSHTNLINFDTRTVSPRAGNPVPVFYDTGTFSGSCDLVCHGVVHDPNSPAENSAYP